MTNKGYTKDRFWIFVLSCFAIFSILEFFRILIMPEFKTFLESHHIYEPLLELSRDLALGFFPIGLTIILMEYWLRSEHKKEVKEYLDEQIGDLYKDRLHRLEHFESSGLMEVCDTVSPDELRDLIASAKRRLLVLVPFFVEPTVLKPVFEQKTRDPGLSIKIVVLHPDSIFLRRRGEVIFDSPESGKHEAIKTLRMLKSAAGATPQRNLEVRTFDSLPTAFLAVADNVALIGFHMNTGTALINPHLKVRLEKENGTLTAFGKMIDEEFKKVLQDSFSSRVDLNLVSLSGNFSLPLPKRAPSRN